MALLSMLIDSREPEWVQGLAFGGVPTAVCQLDAGDLQAGCDDALIVVERKTATDFLNTLRDDRLFPQLARCRELTTWAYLALCGDLRQGAGGKCLCDGRETGWNWSSIQGALLTVQELGVNVLWVASDADYEAAVIRLCNRDRQQVKVRPARDSVLMGNDQIVLASLPGIGVERAKALLDYAGSAAFALSYLTTDDTDKVPGISYAIKFKVRRALGLQHDQVLSVHLRDGIITEDAKGEKVA